MTTKPLPPIFGTTGDTKPLVFVPWEGMIARDIALIVEDDELLAAAMADTLQALAFDTQVALDGRQAIALLGEIVPSIVVLDLHLPVKPGTHSLRHTGMGVLNELRSDSRLTDTLVILATGDARAAEQLGTDADVVLVKPFTCGQLQNLVTRMAS